MAEATRSTTCEVNAPGRLERIAVDRLLLADDPLTQLTSAVSEDDDASDTCSYCGNECQLPADKSAHIEHQRHSSELANELEARWEPGEEILLEPTAEMIASASHAGDAIGQIPVALLDNGGTDGCDNCLGAYCEWSMDVDLSAPNCTESPDPTDRYIKDYYNVLQHILYEANLPETKDRTSKPRRCLSRDNITVVLLSSPTKCMTILLEGGNQCPGDMLLVLSPRWLSKSCSERHRGLYSLYVHKAVMFKSGGRSYLDCFDPPRRVTYFVNFFTRASTDGERSDGETVETDLDCPMSSSMKLVQLVDNKLWTRIKMAECGIGYPETVAFAYRSSIPYAAKLHAITIVHLLTKDGVEALMTEEIERFVNLPELEYIEKIVVKPAGVMWHGSRGVSFHDRSDVTSIVGAAVALLDDIEEENVILVEAFYATLPPDNETGLEWSASKDLALRLKSTVCRGPDNTPVMTKLVAGISNVNGPVNSFNTVPQCFYSVLRAFGIVDETEQKRLYDVIREGSENVFKAITDYESTLSDDERGGIGAQTDIIGIDFVLYAGTTVTQPIAIEVNSHDCTINCQVYEFMNPETRGEAVHPLIQTMISRSQKFIMQGKKILVVGCGGYSKRFIWDAAREYDIDIILVDPDREDFATTKVSVFIEYDLADHSRDDVHVNRICALLDERSLRVDGCVTFWENCGPLAAAVCERLGLTSPGVSAAKIAARKSWTMDRLLTRVCDVPHWPRTPLYATKSFRISSKKDIADAAIKMNFPAVMKLECGSSNSFLGVRLVNDAPSAYIVYDKIQEELASERVERRVKLDSNVVIMEYMAGTEHDVDIIIYRRQLVGAFITDIGPPRLPRFTRVSAALPSFLPPDKVAQLRCAAYQCCVDVGLRNGIYNVKMKMSPAGPKLIEINQRMGDFFTRDWTFAAWGVDLLLYLFMISCSVKPVLPTLKLRCHVVGINILPSVHRTALSDPETLNLLDLLEIQDAIRINRIEEELGLPEDDRYEDAYGNLAIMDADPTMAQNRLIEYSTLLGLSHTDYDVPYFLKYFK